MSTRVRRKHLPDSSRALSDECIRRACGVKLRHPPQPPAGGLLLAPPCGAPAQTNTETHVQGWKASALRKHVSGRKASAFKKQVLCVKLHWGVST